MSSEQLLAVLNQLTLKAFSSESRASLAFLIVNDTCLLAPYGRATLWDIGKRVPRCLAVSGQTAVSADSEAVRDTGALILKLSKKEEAQLVHLPAVSKGAREEIAGSQPARSALWLPATSKGKPTIGLWLERWDGGKWEGEQVKVLQFLMQAYGYAWNSLTPRFAGFTFLKGQWLFAAATALVILFLVPVPLRIVAPCEVVARDPVLISAPLDGIVDEMMVQPGQTVKTGDILFSYDKRVPVQELEVAKKQVEVAESQLNRSTTQGLADKKFLDDAAVWEAQLQKEQANYDFVKKRAEQLDVKAPQEGVAIFDNPDDWRGRRVITGERVLVISDPQHTKVRIWIPEADNVIVDPERAIKVFLNIDPLRSYYARLIYVSASSVVSDKGIVSFTAEAEWEGTAPEAKLGVKGSAILYGENVSLIYWLLRRPLSFFREIMEQ